MTADKGLEVLAVRKLHVEHPTVSFNQGEGVELAQITLVIERAKVTPVDLKALARGRLHAHEATRWGRGHAHLLQILAQDGGAARVARRLQALEDDATGGAGVLLQQLGKERLEGIKLAGAGPVNGQGHGRVEILLDGARVHVELASDAAYRPMLAHCQPVNFVDRVRLQHGCGYRPPRGTTPEGCSLQEASRAVPESPAG